MATEKTIAALVQVVEAWAERRHTEAQAFTRDGFRSFVETQNYNTRQLVAILERQSPEFYSALSELAINAQTLTTPGARIYLAGQDRTNL